LGKQAPAHQGGDQDENRNAPPFAQGIPQGGPRCHKQEGACEQQQHEANAGQGQVRGLFRGPLQPEQVLTLGIVQRGARSGSQAGSQPTWGMYRRFETGLQVLVLDRGVEPEARQGVCLHAAIHGIGMQVHAIGQHQVSGTAGVQGLVGDRCPVRPGYHMALPIHPQARWVLLPGQGQGGLSVHLKSSASSFGFPKKVGRKPVRGGLQRLGGGQ
jgi:hypothetical protein